MLKTKFLTVALASVVASLAAVSSAQAATDYFMKVEIAPGVKETPIHGESVDREFPQLIEIESFSWGAENATTIGSASGGAGTGKATFNELTIDKAVDSTTPRFLRLLGTGAHLASVEIIARRANPSGGASVVPIRTLFQTAFVKAQEQRGTSGEEMHEQLTFAYGAVAQASVSPGSPVKPNVFSSWSQTTNSFITEPLPFPYKA